MTLAIFFPECKTWWVDVAFKMDIKWKHWHESWGNTEWRRRIGLIFAEISYRKASISRLSFLLSFFVLFSFSSSFTFSFFRQVARLLSIREMHFTQWNAEKKNIYICYTHTNPPKAAFHKKKSRQTKYAISFKNI